MTKENNCPICGTSSDTSFIKFGIMYNSCLNCSALYTLSQIPPELIITENDSDLSRNLKEINLERLRRIEQKHLPEYVLDFGCGNGQMTDLINNTKEYEAEGVDQHTKTQLSQFTEGLFDTVIMTEVIEHIYDPISLFKTFHNLMTNQGLIYIESSFVDFLGNPLNSGYVDPRIGHCLVHSKKSIEILAEKTGFKVNWFSPNVVFFIK